MVHDVNTDTTTTTSIHGPPSENSFFSRGFDRLIFAQGLAGTPHVPEDLHQQLGHVPSLHFQEYDPKTLETCLDKEVSIAKNHEDNNVDENDVDEKNNVSDNVQQTREKKTLVKKIQLVRSNL